jgi:hypothetical protein
LITRPATAASNEWLARGSVCASPTLKLARGSATVLRAKATKPSEGSMPVT